VALWYLNKKEYACVAYPEVRGRRPHPLCGASWHPKMPYRCVVRSVAESFSCWCGVRL